MKLSIVTTLYHSAPYVEEFYRRIGEVAQNLTRDYEIVFVNDGSPDNALEIAVGLFARDPRVRVVDLSRNFGHHKAMMTGLAHARGDLVFLIDVDLEEPPESLAQFFNAYQSGNADVVYGVQLQRRDSRFNNLFGSLFYILFNALSDHPIPKNLLTARLMTKRYVEQLLQHKEQLFNIEGLWQITGFKQVPLAIDKTHFKGSSTYGLRRKIAYVMHAITAFSSKPLVCIAYLGLAVFIPTSLYIAYLLIQYFFLGKPVDGWTSTIVSIWFFGGLIVSILGVIAIYLAVIFTEVKQRPYTIVRQVHERDDTMDNS